MTSIKYPALYEQARKIVYSQYDKPSAYRSQALVKKYKQLSMEKHKNDGYKGTKPKKQGVAKWIQEEWIDMKEYIKNGKKVSCGRTTLKEVREYPACRPFTKIDSRTPLTADEVLKLHSKKKLLDLIKQKEQNPKLRIDWEKAELTPLRS